MKYLYRILGSGIILAGVILNEWVIKYLSHDQVKFEGIEKQILIAAVNIFLIVLGILIIRYQKTALQNMILVIASIMTTIGMLEFALHFIRPDMESESPKWVPYQFKQLNTAISEKHSVQSKLNPYGFNDVIHTSNKNPGIFRIAILGDSFVWGAGVEEHQIWTRKLGHLMNQNGLNVEILNWGKSGWSTMDQFNFLKMEGIRYEFDLLLIGFVVNDPVMDGSLHKSFIYEGGIIDRIIVQPISRLIPNAVSLLVDIINRFFDTHFDYGYSKWLDQIYSKENLEQYQLLLNQISEFCNSRHIPLLVVMTPENHNPMLQERFEIITGLFRNAGMDYFNLYPDVYSQLHNIPNRKLWANPADGHPGDKVSDVYVHGIYKYLIDSGYLNKILPIGNQAVNLG